MSENARTAEHRQSKAVKKTLADYTVVTRPDDNGTFVAYVPAIDGCHAWGRTAEEARAELAAVFDMLAEEYAAKGRPLPRDVEVTVARAG